MNMNNLMKQAQQMQAKLAMLQNELNDREVEELPAAEWLKLRLMESNNC